MRLRFPRSDFPGPGEVLYPPAQLEDGVADSDLSDRLVSLFLPNYLTPVNQYVFILEYCQKAAAVTPLVHLGSFQRMIWRRVEKKGCPMMTNCLILIQTRGGFHCFSLPIIENSRRQSLGVILFSFPSRARKGALLKRRRSPKAPEESKVKKKPGPKPGWKNQFKPKGYTHLLRTQFGTITKAQKGPKNKDKRCAADKKILL